MSDGPSKDQRIVAVIQARMTSSRLPGKTLETMAGRPMLQVMLERLRGGANNVAYVVATSADSSDDSIAELCAELQLPCVRGELHDVLARYVRALDIFEPDVALRLNGDNPLLDAAAVDAGLVAWEAQEQEKAVGVSNHLSDRWDPLGYCVEVFDPDALRQLHRKERTDTEREHVTLAFKRIGGYESFHILGRNLRHMRWTVDTKQDFDYVTHLFEELGTDVSASEAVSWCEKNRHPGDLDEDGRYR